jgi:transcriptional regulator with XRE-family HTH domain
MVSERMADKVKFPDFAQRLEHACESNPNVPSRNYGRLDWIATQLRERFGTEVTIETVRKWLAGETRPRTEKLMQLATLLQVDPEYLLMGRSTGITEKDRRQQSAEATGIVNVLAGYVAMDGGRPAFPQEDDRRAKKSHIDLYAVIKGAHYAFSVAHGKKGSEGWEFAVPVNALDEAVVIGAVRSANFCCDFLELDAEAVRSKGQRKGEVFQVKVPADLEGTPWKRIHTFSERI